MQFFNWKRNGELAQVLGAKIAQIVLKSCPLRAPTLVNTDCSA